MRVEQSVWKAGEWIGQQSFGKEAVLVFVFGGTDVLSRSDWFEQLRVSYPEAHLFGCSTAGEIADIRVFEGRIVATAVCLDHTDIALARVQMDSVSSSTEAGERIAQAVDPKGLAHVFVLSDGQSVNGSELVRGIYSHLPEGVRVTGGLAGDGARFEKTLVLAGDQPTEGTVGAIAFYGDRIRVGCGSLGGWDPFGPLRIITRSEGNVLFEFDGKPALQLYKDYLGEHARGLPATGLLFPLRIRRECGHELVRTILSVDESQQSLTFAGDVPQGSMAQLMKANFDRLIDGACDAARQSHADGDSSPDLAILISCVGRKLVLQQRTEEEVEAVREVLGASATLTGFYSYGEICPTAPGACCDLHNQTMTITTFAE